MSNPKCLFGGDKMNETNGMQEAKTIDFLMNLSLFDGLKANELRTLSGYMNFIEMDKDEVLFREGDQGDCVCFIVEGRLDVLKQSASGEHNVLATLSRGRPIGEMSVIDDFPRSATVRACKAAKLITLTRKDFELILEEKPLIGIKILKKIARLLSLNLRKTSSQLVDLIL